MYNSNSSPFGRGVDVTRLRVLVYARESRDDNGQFYERIETQRDQLVKFCKENGLINFVRDPIMDDNKSGTNFDRLADVKKMIEHGEVDVIVFKDSARLGRNQLESLKFMEMTRRHNVLPVFANEGFDPDMFGLFAWFNERRAKDDSIKIRGVMRHRMETGELVIRPTFGYRKEGKKLVVDEDQAKVVRMIYELALEGKGSRAIAYQLNAQGFPTPSQISNRQNFPVAYAWNQTHVLRILRNEQYKGMMIHGKRRKKSFLDKSATNVPEEDWVVLDNHHEAIVSKEIWERANMVRLPHGSSKTKTVSLFAGLLRCGRCGSTLVHVARKQRLNEGYICAKYQKEGKVKDHIRPNYGCVTHRISMDDAKNAVLAYIQNLFQDEADFERTVHLVQNSKKKDDTAFRIAKVKQELTKVGTSLEQMYEHLLEGLIDKDMYKKKSEEYARKREDLERTLKQMTGESAKQRQLRFSALKQILQEPDTLDYATLVGCFERIVYYLPGEIDEKSKVLYGLTSEEFEFIVKNGGLLFISR